MLRTIEKYEDLRNRFLEERLRILYLLAIAGNPTLLAVDYMQGDHWQSLFLLRVVMQVIWISGYLILRYQKSPLFLQFLLILWILGANICISEMTIVLGGFSSLYFTGLDFICLCAALVASVAWKSHFIAQLGTLLYYLGANLLRNTGVINLGEISLNLILLVWTCIALLISVFLYERLHRSQFEAQQKLLELDRIKSEFFANISHELRTPLTLCLGAFKSLRTRSLQADCHELIEQGLRNGSRLLYLINELLDLTKFDAGRTTLNKQAFDLTTLLREVAASFQSSNDRRIHFRGMNHPVPLEGDPRQLKHVIYNLLSNALKFSDPTDGQVWLKLSEHDNHVHLEVEDNGIGMPEEHLKRIFDRFTQIEGSATRRHEGSGIGLALVKEIVILHGGEVTVESRIEEGSIFTITLPQGSATVANLVPVGDEESFELPNSSDDEQPLTTGIIAPPQPASPEASLILVADDNTDMRRYLYRVLHPHYRLALAKDGLDALEQAQTIRPDLILTDMMMPRMSGNDLVQAIRQQDGLSRTPVIFLTARAGMEARVESLDEGADDYLTKPFHEEELLARVRNLLGMRAQEQTLLELQKEQFQRFLPAHLNDLLLSDQGGDLLKPHRSDITVLFVDLRGFTPFAEKAEPEDVITVLQEYHARLGQLIVASGCTIERFVGDGIMVFFNDPQPIPDHAFQAVRLALDLHACLADLRLQWSKRGIQLGVGMGLASGFTTLGMVGYEGRQEYSATGTVPNLAARLCGVAQDGQTLISEKTFALVEAQVQAQSVAPFTLKGIHQPVSAYTVFSVT